ncbi:hypothetical protein LEN26_016795 [Aphanomyces euteiches]|nr:hypothetical protein LEN26_016795 [Aphanomyces euteiches]
MLRVVGDAVDGSARQTSVGNALTTHFEFDEMDMEKEDELAPAPVQRRHERLWYLIDTFISTNKGQAILLVVLCIVVATTLAPFVEMVNDDGYAESVWRVWTYMTDTGTQNHATTHGQKVVAFFFTLIGFVYFAVVVAFVVDAIREKMDQLKHGRTQVVEVGHSLMLGWSDKSIPYIGEICSANESERGGVVVVLAEQDSEVMAAAFHSQITSLKGTRVIFRSGNPLLTADLNMVSAHMARSICIMSTDRDAGISDANLLRMILAINSLSELNGHVVGDTSDIDNEPLLELVGGSVLESLVSNDIMGRLIVMCSRSPGLAKVYDALLGFSGNEFYFETWPQCVGMTFGKLAERFPDAIPIGYKDVRGRVHILPPMQRRMQPDEALLVLAEDNDTYKPVEPTAEVTLGDGVIETISDPPPTPQKILICGWRRDIRDMLRMLDALSHPGTVVYMLNEEPPRDRVSMLMEDGLDIRSLRNLTFVHVQGNTAVRRHVMQIRLGDFDSYMVLCDAKRESDILESDSHVLATVLMLRSVEIEQHKSKAKKLFAKTIVSELQSRHRKTPCIAEVLDPRTQKTIQKNDQIGHSSDFVQTNELISRMLAMVSENRLVKPILDDLLSGKGAAFDVVPATRYCAKDASLSFMQLVKRAQLANEIVCGYQPHKSLVRTELNPSNKFRVHNGWDKMDLVILREGRQEKDRHRMQTVCKAFVDGLHRKRGRDQMSKAAAAAAAIEVLDRDQFDSMPRNEHAGEQGGATLKWANGHHQSAPAGGRRKAMQRHQSDKKLFQVPTGARLADLWVMADDMTQLVHELNL